MRNRNWKRRFAEMMRTGLLAGAVFVVTPSLRAADPAVAGAPGPVPKSASGPQPTTTAARKGVSWQQLSTPVYPAYLDRLREAGCPEDKIRLIVRADADEWLLQQRVQQAVASDFPWWKLEPPLTGGETLGDKSDELRKRRAELIKGLIGDTEPEPATGTKEVRIVVNLCGPVLGGLPREKFNAVQEICARSLDRHQGYFNNRQNEGIFLNQGDLAQLREQTRADLSEILTPEELEEFLLRYSHNSNRLRLELAALEPLPEEFRSIFRAVDSLEHRLQLEFGALDSLSARQRETFERQREEAIKKILAPERYTKYVIGRYPLFRQAQLAVRRAGLADMTTLGFYEVLQEHESRRRELLNNTALAGDQRQLGLQDLERAKEAGLKKVLGDEGYRQYRDSLGN